MKLMYVFYDSASIKPAQGQLHNIHSAHSNKVTTHIQTCIPLSHQALDAFLKEFQRLLLEKIVSSLFHMTVRLKLVSLECLLQWLKYVEVGPYARCSSTSQCMCCTLVLMVFTMWGCALPFNCLHESHHCFSQTRVAIHGLHPLINLCWLAALRAQKLNHSTMILLGWNVIHHIF
jgi:hypothetical protein